MNKPRIILDTNIFLVSLAPKYKYHWIYQALLEGKFELAISNEILPNITSKSLLDREWKERMLP